MLLLANALLWLYQDSLGPKQAVTIAAQQTLPRVADLRTTQIEQSSERHQPPAGKLGEVESVVIPQEPQRQRYCTRLGWFESAAEASEAYLTLGSPGTNHEIREVERELPSLHWVIIPPQPDARAQALFRDLQRRGIDSYLVRQGENRNAISLGLFESRQAADDVLEEKKSQNLNAILANFPRNQISYALVFEDRLIPGSGAVPAAETDYGSNFELVEIRRCEGVATAPQNP